MPQNDNPPPDPYRRFEEDFQRTFRPDHSRAGRTTPRTLAEVDAIEEGEAE